MTEIGVQVTPTKASTSWTTTPTRPSSLAIAGSLAFPTVSQHWNRIHLSITIVSVPKISTHLDGSSVALASRLSGDRKGGESSGDESEFELHGEGGLKLERRLLVRVKI